MPCRTRIVRRYAKHITIDGGSLGETKLRFEKVAFGQQEDSRAGLEIQRVIELLECLVELAQTDQCPRLGGECGSSRAQFLQRNLCTARFMRGPLCLPRRERKAKGEGKHSCCGRGEDQAIPPDHSAKAIELARWTSKNRLQRKVATQIGGQVVCRFVSAGSILLQALHHDPVEIAAE